MRCSRRISPGSRAGLTLVELLLVTAVLSILAAILLPLFMRVRESCHRTRCACNLRRLGEAFTLYSDDWEGFWPCPGGLAGDRGYWSQSGNGGLQGYVRQRGLNSVWCCPLLTEWGGRYPARSYSMNSYLRTPQDVEYPSCTAFLKGINTNRLLQPQRTILLYEGVPLSGDYQNQAYSEDQVYYIYRCANWSWVRGYYSKTIHTVRPGEPWHGRTNNYLYSDGHIVSRPPYRYSGNLLASYDEMREWYVDKVRFSQRFAGMR